MLRSKEIEIWVGIFVTLGLTALVVLAIKVSHLGNVLADTGYAITARFENIGGLKVRAPVKMGGVRIGRVSAIRFDDEKYQALVTMHIDPQYSRIPVDTSASIFTAGLLGEQYISLVPGAEEEYLSNNHELDPGLTQSAVILEQLIGQFLYNTAANSKVNPKESNP